MQLERVTLSRFCGFDEFDVDLGQLTVLVGPNNGGKTTVLRAVQLVFDAVRQCFGDTELPDVSVLERRSIEGNVATLARRNGFQDPSLLYRGRDRQIAASIRLHLRDDERTVTVSLEFKDATSNYVLDLMLGDSNLRESSLDVRRAVVNAVHRTGSLFVPSSGALSPVETVLQFSELESQLAQGRSAETWRNQMQWLNEGRAPEFFQSVVDRVSAHIPGVSIRPPRRSRTSNTVESTYVEDGVEYDIASSGSGVRSLVTVAASIELSDADVLLFDEPEAHLHAAVQRDLARLLAEAATGSRQILVATHSADLIEEVPLDSLVWIDRTQARGRRCDALETALADLGALSRAAAISHLGADLLLYFEAKPDRRVFRALMGRIGKDDLAARARLECLFGVGAVSHIRGVARVLRERLGLGIGVGVVRDADYTTATPPSEPDESDGFVVVQLPCKELENLIVMSPAALASAVRDELVRRASRTGESSATPPSEEDLAHLVDEVSADATVRRAMESQWLVCYAKGAGRSLDDVGYLQHAMERLDQLWGDPIWRRRCVPGKLVLKRLRERIADLYGVSVGLDACFRHYEPTPEIVAVFDAVERCAPGRTDIGADRG